MATPRLFRECWLIGFPQEVIRLAKFISGREFDRGAAADRGPDTYNALLIIFVYRLRFAKPERLDEW